MSAWFKLAHRSPCELENINEITGRQVEAGEAGEVSISVPGKPISNPLDTFANLISKIIFILIGDLNCWQYE